MQQWTERRMLDLLAARYTAVREYTIADRWVRAEHVPSALGFKAKRIADFIAVDRYPGMPYGSALAYHGHEVKVSRSDWLTELRDPEKADEFKRYMHHWWLVVPDATIVKPDELPEDWGLLVSSGRGLRAKVKAPRLTPDPMPADFVACLMGAAARTAHREPLHRDAPAVRQPGSSVACGFCGEPSPCAVHQPRATAERIASSA